MAGAYEKLEGLDPSDSMKRAMEIIDLLLDQIEEEADHEVVSRALELIAERERQAVSYYMRPLDSDSIYNRLIDLHEARKKDEIALHYKSMIDQRRARKWTTYGDLHAVMGDNTLAVKYIERALFYGPRDDVIEDVKNALSRARKRMEKAEIGLPRVLKKLNDRPLDARLIGDGAKYLTDLNRVDDAIRMNGRGLEIRPDDLDLLHRKGCLQFLSGERRQALLTFSKLKEMNPNSTKARSAYNWTVELLDREMDKE